MTETTKGADVKGDPVFNCVLRYIQDVMTPDSLMRYGGAHEHAMKLTKRLATLSPTSAPPEEAGSEKCYVDVVFDGPPSHESGRFVEVEGSDGRSLRFGDWIEREDGLWALRVPVPWDDYQEATRFAATGQPKRRATPAGSGLREYERAKLAYAEALLGRMMWDHDRSDVEVTGEDVERAELALDGAVARVAIRGATPAGSGEQWSDAKLRAMADLEDQYGPVTAGSPSDNVLEYDVLSVNGRAMEWKAPLWEGIHEYERATTTTSRQAAVVKIEGAVEKAVRMAIHGATPAGSGEGCDRAETPEAAWARGLDELRVAGDIEEVRRALDGPLAILYGRLRTLAEISGVQPAALAAELARMAERRYAEDPETICRQCRRPRRDHERAPNGDPNGECFDGGAFVPVPQGGGPSRAGP